MASKKNKKSKEGEEVNNQPHSTPWISMNSGIKIIIIVSIAMVVLTAWQVIPQLGWFEGIKYGLLFGAMIWAVFLGTQLFFRLTRR